MSTERIPSTFPVGIVEARRQSKRSRTTHDDSDEDSEYEEETAQEYNSHLLQDIVTKLVNLTTIVNELNTKIDTHITSCQGDQSARDLHSQVLSTQQALLKINENQYEEDKRKKFRCIPRWGELHRTRRDAYYKHYAVTTEADIMEGYLAAEPPYILKEYRPRYSPGEKPDRYKLRESLAKSAMMVEINQKKITATEQLDKYTEVDKEISDLCDKLENEEDKDYLKQLWSKEVTAAEEKSQTFYNQKKKPWWLNLSTKFPYTGQPKEPNQNGASTEPSNPPNAAPVHDTDQHNEELEDNDLAGEAPFQEVIRNRRRRSPDTDITPQHYHNQRGQPRGRSNRGNGTRRGSGPTRGYGTSRGRGQSYNRGTFRGRSQSRGRGTTRGRDTSRGRGTSKGRGTSHSRVSYRDANQGLDHREQQRRQDFQQGNNRRPR